MKFGEELKYKEGDKVKIIGGSKEGKTGIIVSCLLLAKGYFVNVDGDHFETAEYNLEKV